MALQACHGLVLHPYQAWKKRWSLEPGSEVPRFFVRPYLLGPDKACRGIILAAFRNFFPFTRPSIFTSAASHDSSLH